MRVYISGRIKDYPGFLEHFERGERYLRSLGLEPVNPCTLEHIEEATYEDFMRADLAALLECQVILMLSGWEKSNGARVEHIVAAACGMRFLYEDLIGQRINLP